uniref:Uncharacterized protein n=1 Tax=Anopheles stephensi TaxID=30069 RepID=A0A182YJU5_ANOST
SVESVEQSNRIVVTPGKTSARIGVNFPSPLSTPVGVDRVKLIPVEMPCKCCGNDCKCASGCGNGQPCATDCKCACASGGCKEKSGGCCGK